MCVLVHVCVFIYMHVEARKRPLVVLSHFFLRQTLLLARSLPCSLGRLARESQRSSYLQTHTTGIIGVHNHTEVSGVLVAFPSFPQVLELKPSSSGL